MAISSPETRAASRDYWNSKPVTIVCRVLDVFTIWTGVAIFAALASLNNF